MGKKIGLGLFFVIAALVVAIALQPSDFKVSRSLAMAAPASAIFPHVNNFHNWNAWSPWAKVDPNAKAIFNGPAEGLGSQFTWDGNNDVGTGTMTIVESRPSEYIQLRMDFLKPMKGTNTAEFSFKPEGKQTLVTWSMSGKKDFMGKAMSLIMNCDQMVGGMFEKGLVSMKAIVEKKTL